MIFRLCQCFPSSVRGLVAATSTVRGELSNDRIVISVAILILHQYGEPATSTVGRKIKWSAKSFWSSISTEPGSSSPASGESGTGVAFKLKTALRLVLDPETEKMIQKLRKICLLEKLSQAQDSAQVSSQSSCWDKSLSWINQPQTETHFKV